jgi:hypothetical protein
MLPVPRGPAEVELRYVGGRLLVFSFWLSAAGWAVVLLGFMSTIAGFDCLAWAARAGSRSAAAARGLWAHKWIWAGGLAAAGAATFAVGHRRAYLEAVGPIRVTFLLPSGPIGQTQPILVTGKTGAATTVFVTCLDATHLQVGADIWGTLHQSQPLEIDYAQKHEIVVNSSALYPLDHPRTRRLDPWARERLRRDFRVELDGVTVLAAKALAFESTVGDVTVGKSRVGGSYGAAPFLGEILAVERLSVPEVLALSPDQRLHLRVAFPEDRNGHTETLVAVGRDGADGICAVRYLADRRVRFLWQSREGEVWSSADATIAPGAHGLELAFAPGPGHLASHWVLDGNSVLGRARTAPPTRILLVSVGRADAASGADVRFSGDFEAWRSDPAGATPAKEGPIRLVLNFPTDRAGHAEPLLTTGRNRSGDFAYVTYVDAGHVRFGLDHWGKGGRQSDPIAVDYQSLHEIRIHLGSLFPGPADEAAWAGVPPDLRQRYQNEMEIVLDGKPVLSAPFPAYPTTTEEITPGRNAIGGSSCEAVFSGELFSCDRLGLDLTAPAR